MTVLPQTGTRALLEKLSPFLNDTFINDLIPPLRGAGRPRTFSSAQLFRTLLLSLLTPAHSFNLWSGFWWKIVLGANLHPCRISVFFPMQRCCINIAAAWI